MIVKPHTWYLYTCSYKYVVYMFILTQINRATPPPVDYIQSHNSPATSDVAKVHHHVIFPASKLQLMYDTRLT